MKTNFSNDSGQRSACYSSDLLLRQYRRVKGEKKKAFSVDLLCWLLPRQLLSSRSLTVSFPPLKIENR